MSRTASTLGVIFLTLTIAATAVAGWEWWWREQSYTPALYDDRDLWAAHRHRAVTVDQDRNFTVIGASRIQLAFSTAAFEQSLPGWKATSLAINGHYPLAVLEDLAADERFTGTLLVAIDARGLSHWYQDMSAPWVQHYHRNFGPQRRIERRLRSSLQARLVSAGSDFNLVRRLVGWIDEIPPPRHYTRQLRDRTIVADFSQADVAGLRRHFVAALADDYEQRPAPTPERWLADLVDTRNAVAAIQARGGTVVFIRMPTGNGHWELDQENYPRNRYWDQLGGTTGAVTVHFADHPELARLELPDTSHIDGHDRAHFTEVLIQLLADQELLPRAAR